MLELKHLFARLVFVLVLHHFHSSGVIGFAESPAAESATVVSAGAVVSATAGAAVSATTGAAVSAGATELEEATTEELLATLELEGATELDDNAALETGATLLLETAAELDETTVSLDWAASASASNSAKRSRGWAKDWATKTLATQAINE